jgi:outer membrane receptor for ferric coprogen and ferric-rhodotorulic acid
MANKQFGRGMSRIFWGSRSRLLWGLPYAAIVVASATVGYQSIHNSSAQATLLNGQVQLSVDKHQYVIGDPIRFTLTNYLKDTVQVANHCPAEPLEVYRLESGAWQRLHDTTDPAKCQHELRSYALYPQTPTSADYRYWPHLFNRTGTYRIVAPIDGYTDGPTVDFTIVTP